MAARFLLLLALLGVWLQLSSGLHVAFLLPPASPMGSMIPVALGCLDAGHQVTLLANDEFEGKVRGMVPKANFIGLGPAQRPEMDEATMAVIFRTPYMMMPFVVNLAFTVILNSIVGFPLAQASLPELRRLRPDVLCTTTALPSTYAAGEALGVPVVGLGFGPQTWMTMLDVPWSLEPAMGSWYSRGEIACNPALVLWNSAARFHGLFTRVLGTFVHNVFRLKLGLSTLEASQFDAVFASPMVIPSLPELTAGYPTINSANSVMAGMYDHPALEGASLGKSDQHAEIIAWLDKQRENGKDVLYAAFGSEVILDIKFIELFLQAFENLTVLWALKKPPSGLTPPPGVLVAKWTPQKAVLAHPSIKAFLSHGGQNSVREALAAGVPMLIMPIIFDGPSVAMVHEELGVALRMDKNNITPQSVTASFKRICSDVFQQRAAHLKDLNDRHVSLGRAVEVIENAAADAASGSVAVNPKHYSAVFGQFVAIGGLLLWICILRSCCRCARRSCGCCCRCCGSARDAGKAHMEMSKKQD